MDTLHVDSVIKSFGAKQVLTDVYLLCKTGEIIGLLGRNGSGKSTLLNIIFGSLKADRKYVKVNQKIITGLADNKKLINYLPQDSFLPGHIKISTAISLFCNHENAESIKSRSFIKPLLNRKSKTLSTGEVRLVEIIMMIFSDAKFVLIDEPFNGIAPIYKQEIKQVIWEQSKFKGFIITDHDYRNIMDISTKTILMHDGGTRTINSLHDLVSLGFTNTLS